MLSFCAGSPRLEGTTCPSAKRVALPRVICRDEMGRDETERDCRRRGKEGTRTSRRTADEEKQRPPRSRKLNPPTPRWVGRQANRAVSINKQKLSCYRCRGAKGLSGQDARRALHGNRPEACFKPTHPYVEHVCHLSPFR